MAVTEDDVRHVAELARLAIDESRIESLAVELNSILVHMDQLAQVDTTAVEAAIPTPGVSTPLRGDGSGPLPMFSPKETFAPEMRDGLFTVPRLASHEEGAETTP